MWYSLWYNIFCLRGGGDYSPLSPRPVSAPAIHTACFDWHIPGLRLFDTVPIWPMTWRPIEPHMLQIGQLLRSLSRRKLRLRERPIRRTCRRWSFVPSTRHHPTSNDVDLTVLHIEFIIMLPCFRDSVKEYKRWGKMWKYETITYYYYKLFHAVVKRQWTNNKQVIL